MNLKEKKTAGLETRLTDTQISESGVYRFDRERILKDELRKRAVDLSKRMGLRIGILTSLGPFSIVNMICGALHGFYGYKIMFDSNMTPYYSTYTTPSKPVYDMLLILTVILWLVVWIVLSQLITAAFCVSYSLKKVKFSTVEERYVLRRYMEKRFNWRDVRFEGDTAYGTVRN